MTRSWLTVVAVSILAVLAAVARGQQLPSDPAVVSGRLDNGLRYMIKPHATPPGRAEVWIHMHTGSLNETDRQRGLAHYLEHMAFNGSANFAPGTLVPLFQSLGMTFGRDQNAFTSFDQTTYQLSLPDTKPATLAKGFTFFADVVGRLSLLPAEIDDERGIIQEERRRGLSGRQRVSFYVLERMAPGSLFGERITIGTEETINSVNQDDFKDYYDRWYGASNATLMVVADADPQQILAQVKEAFGSLPAKPRPEPQDINVRAYDKSFAIVASDPEIRSEDIRIMRLEPARPPVTTVAGMRDELVASLGRMAMNRRFRDKTSAGGTAYLNAGVSLGNDSGAIYTAELSASASPGKWKQALDQVALELQRARTFGFSSRELDNARRELISGAERAVETEATTQSRAIISGMNAAISDGEPYMSPTQRLDLLNQLLPDINADEVSRRFAQEFDPKAVAFVATLPAGADIPTEAQLVELGTKALAVTPSEESEAIHATTLMAAKPTPGTVAQEQTHDASQVWSAWLSNNVRVHHRFMDQRKNQVSVTIDLIGGEMLESADNRGITSAATVAWSSPATRSLSSSDIRSIMTGKKVNVGGGGFGGRGGGRRGGGGGGSADSISLSISGSPDELETGFQLAYLLLTEPKIESAAFDQFKTRTLTRLEESLNNPLAFGMRAASGFLYPEDQVRLQPVTADQVNRLSIDAAQAWLDSLIRTSPIEVVIVGDIQRDKAVELVNAYLGALPSRDRVSAETYKQLRSIQRPSGPRVLDTTLATPTQQAFVMSGFYGADRTDVAETRAMAYAASILSSRMIKQVREEAQLVYSIGAGSRPGSTYPGFGAFNAAAPTEPAKVDALVQKLAAMYAEFAASGPTDEELQVARRQMANTLEEEMRDPSYWSRRLQQITFFGGSLDDIVNEQSASQAVTADQIKSVFAKYAVPANSLTVIVRPVSPAG